MAAGVALATGVGALVWYLKRREDKTAEDEEPSEAKQGPTPSGPPRETEEADGSTPDSEKDKRHRPAFDFLDRDTLPAALIEAIDDSFGNGWAASEEVVDDLEPEDVVVFAVKSQPTGPYTRPVEEVLSGHVLEVEDEAVKTRVMGPVKHSEHFGTKAGHGLRAGAIVDVPKSVILVAASEQTGDGYDGRGPSVAAFKPTSHTKQVYEVRPGTPYDLKMPYRTEELEWYIEPNTGVMLHIGQDGLLEQIMFPEDNPRGSFVVRCLDNDPEVGKVLVGRWEFELGA
ncbi:hypothetical protein [Plesiocystis pacifica]|uniref:hypothetical protein n=1 Tax=Plesiocystis pacifica TaxID=191768 RepID=UPI001E41E937|nr:hypothetical protein [Plesiocystis pacifica]